MASSEPRRRVSRQASKLSDERLARKRALDREAQRHSRSKTKNHIALLESRIEALTRVKANGDTKELVDKIEEQRRENEQLKSTLKTIGKIVGGDVVGGMLETSNSTSTLMKKPSTPESEDNYEQVPTTAENEQQVESIDLGELPEGLELPESCSLSQDVVRKSVEGNHGMGTDTQLQLTNGAMDFSFDPRSPSYDIPFNFQTSLFNRPLWSTTAPYTTCKCCRIVTFTSEILSKCSTLTLQNTTHQRSRDADIPIRAILYGWNAVTRKYSLDPLWSSLRHADEVILSKCAPMERLVVLRNLCLMLRYRVNPTPATLSAIPSYLHERPSQKHIPHEPLTDYLVWPGLRERIVFAPHLYCSEKFSSLFWSSFRFNWGKEFRDAYVREKESGLYRYSEALEEAIADLGNFCMDEVFLTEFPELRADISAVGEGVKKRVGEERYEEVFGDVGGRAVGGLEELELLSAGLLGGEGFFA